MCWVACDRLGQIAETIGMHDRARHWRDKAHTFGSAFSAGAWDPERKAIVGAMGNTYLDASVLLISELGLLPPGDERFRSTCDAIGRNLLRKRPHYAVYGA